MSAYGRRCEDDGKDWLSAKMVVRIIYDFSPTKEGYKQDFVVTISLLGSGLA